MKAFIALLLVVLILVFFAWRSQSKWLAYTNLTTQQITDEPLAKQAHVDLSEIENLPPIVQKYFRLTLKDHAPIIQRMHLSQVGGFRAKPELKDWQPMSAEQYFSTTLPGFAWKAKIQMVPGISIEVCDSFLNQHGQMKGTVTGIFPIINAHDRPELDQGALQRYLAEAVWFPTALLPSQGVTWETIDDHKALATLSVGSTNASLEFEFNDQGEIVSAYSPNRYREVSGNFIPTPWKGSYANYETINRYRVPTYAEVAWLLPDQVYAYFRANIGHIEFE